MATYRDAALAAHAATHADYLARGRERLRPLMTDSTGKVILDPALKTVVAHEDADAGMVVYTTSDGSDVSFAAYPDDAARPVAVVALVDGAWTRLGEVRDLADVGRVLAEAAA